MKFKVEIYKPGILDYNRKTGEPIPFPPEVQEFDANSGTEALNIARKLYEATGLKRQSFFNVGLA